MTDLLGSEMKKLFSSFIEAFLAWGLIYFGLWILTGKWGFEISEDIWRVAVLLICLVIARMSAYAKGLREGKG